MTESPADRSAPPATWVDKIPPSLFVLPHAVGAAGIYWLMMTLLKDSGPHWLDVCLFGGFMFLVYWFLERRRRRKRKAIMKGEV